LFYGCSTVILIGFTCPALAVATTGTVVGRDPRRGQAPHAITHYFLYYLLAVARLLCLSRLLSHRSMLCLLPSLPRCAVLRYDMPVFGFVVVRSSSLSLHIFVSFACFLCSGRSPRGEVLRTRSPGCRDVAEPHCQKLALSFAQDLLAS